MSKDWGLPPWEICWDKGKALWVLRYRIWNETIDNARRDKDKHK